MGLDGEVFVTYYSMAPGSENCRGGILYQMSFYRTEITYKGLAQL